MNEETEYYQYDKATQIMHLTCVIRALCEENNISKRVVIEDFIYLINREDEKK